MLATEDNKIKDYNLNRFLTSGFDFEEKERNLQFRFRTLNYFMALSLFFGLLIGSLGLTGLMNIGESQPYVNIFYAVYNFILIFILRINKNWYRKVAWAQVISSLTVFAAALATVVHDEFRMAWFYVSAYLTYMLLGVRSGNILTSITIIVIIFIHYYFDLNLSNTAIQTAILSLIVFALLSRVYDLQIKSYEMQLQNKNNDLASVIKNLDYALESAKSASKAKTLFLANMSHEIRTPMNGMLSLIQVLHTTKLDEQQHDYLKSIKRSGMILISLIDDLLDLSRIESGKLILNSKEFKVWSVVEDILLQVEYLFEEGSVYFNVDISDDIPPCLVTDEVRLKQVVINLINNAAKFTSSGEVTLTINGHIKYEVYYNLHIKVADTGMGIPQDKIKSIFEPFQQISKNRIYNKGVGLGLPICKRIMEAMNGSIKVESTEGKGTTFSLDVVFPIGDLSKIETVKKTKNIHLKPLVILVVEDDKISCLAVKTWLTYKGHKITVAENGQLAVDYLQNNKVDVILMDVHMPEMDGVQATKIIKEKNLSTAPIIGMTASVMNDERKSYIEAGMDVLVEKPVNFDDLISIIKDKLN